MTQTDTNLVSEAAKIYKVLSNSRLISFFLFHFFHGTRLFIIFVI